MKVLEELATATRTLQLLLQQGPSLGEHWTPWRRLQRLALFSSSLRLEFIRGWQHWKEWTFCYISNTKLHRKTWVTDLLLGFSGKIVRKPFIYNDLWLLSLKNDVNAPSRSTVISKRKLESRNKTNFCWRLEGHWWQEQDSEPDSLVRGTNSRIRIRTKMSRIRNTG